MISITFWNSKSNETESASYIWENSYILIEKYYMKKMFQIKKKYYLKTILIWQLKNLKS
jgi:hypothetical protein